MPRLSAISLASAGCALPEKILSCPWFTSLAWGASPPQTPSLNGWGGRIRTFEYGIQSPAPYRLATPHLVGANTGVYHRRFRRPASWRVTVRVRRTSQSGRFRRFAARVATLSGKTPNTADPLPDIAAAS